MTAAATDGVRAQGVDMEQTSPDHLFPKKKNDHRERREQFMFRSPNPAPSWDLPRTLYRVKIPVSQVGEWSGPGSSLCQTGRLGVHEEGLYVVQARGGSLDVAWGDGRNLRDPTSYARDGKVYMFFMHGTSACRVYVR